MNYNPQWRGRTRTWTTETITGRYGSDISDAWKRISNNAGSNDWYNNSSFSGNTTSLLNCMPLEGREYFTKKQDGSNSQTAHYYTQNLDGKTYTEALSVTAYYSGSEGYSVTAEDYPADMFTGFTFDHYTVEKYTSRGKPSFGDAKFYYRRNTYKLSFDNGAGTCETKSIKYGASLAGYKDKQPKTRPGNVPDDYTFTGWYTDSACTKKFDFDNTTMPYENLVVYAGWAAPTYTLTVISESIAGGSDVVTDIPKGTIVSEQASWTFVPEGDDREFLYWVDENSKIFDFSMPINKDKTVTAVFRNDNLVDVVIHYVKQGTGEQILSDTKTTCFFGETRTFEALVKSGMFPLTNSHTIFVSKQSSDPDLVYYPATDTSPERFEYSFKYVSKASVEYTIEYREKGTETVLKTKVEGSTSDNVMTFKAPSISGYMPIDREIVYTMQADNNVITFYYKKADGKLADVEIIHYKYDPNSHELEREKRYTMIQSEKVLNQKVGDTFIYDGYKLNLTGYKFDHAKSDNDDGASYWYC